MTLEYFTALMQVAAYLPTALEGEQGEPRIAQQQVKERQEPSAWRGHGDIWL